MEDIRREITETGLAKRVGEKVSLKHASTEMTHIGRVRKLKIPKPSFYIDTSGFGSYPICAKDIITVTHRSKSGKETFHRYRVRLNQPF